MSPHAHLPLVIARLWVHRIFTVDSLESARTLRVREHRRWLEEAGVKVEGKVEVSPLVALDAKELKQKLNSVNWSSRTTLENLQIELENGRVMGSLEETV